jgi:hypothetical protein
MKSSSRCFTFAVLGGFRRPQCQAGPNRAQQIHDPKQNKWWAGEAQEHKDGEKDNDG